MANIDDLSISYPDFQLNTAIEPEQFDTNNLEIVTKINAILNRLHSTTVGTSGATEVKVSPVGTRTYTNLQDALAFIDSSLLSIIADITSNDIDIANNTSAINTNNTATNNKFTALDTSMVNFDIRQGAHESSMTNQMLTGDTTINSRVTNEINALRDDLTSNNNSYKTILTNIQAQFQAIIDLGGNPSVEVVQARDIFASLKARLDSMDTKITPIVIQDTIPTVENSVEGTLYFVYDITV